MVTGGTRGIGRGIANYFMNNGFFAVVCARHTPEKTLFPGNEENYLFIPCDISKQQDRANLVEKTLNMLGRVDVLVNNAGIAPPKRMDILETTEESFDLVMKVNLYGPFFLTQRIANQMIQTKKNGLDISPTEGSDEPIERKSLDYSPSILNISSISAYTSSTSRGEYCVSKAGVSMMTKLFADRLAEHEIPVFEIRPGIIQTPMTAAVKGKYNKMIEEGVFPLKRWGYPKDVAKACYALATGMVPYSTGDVLNIDGGFHLKRL